MKYLNHKRIKIICGFLVFFNISHLAAATIIFGLNRTDIYLSFILFFLIGLFYFLATTYFVYVNDQFVNYRSDLSKEVAKIIANLNSNGNEIIVTNEKLIELNEKHEIANNSIDKSFRHIQTLVDKKLIKNILKDLEASILKNSTNEIGGKLIKIDANLKSSTNQIRERFLTTEASFKNSFQEMDNRIQNGLNNLVNNEIVEIKEKINISFDHLKIIPDNKVFENGILKLLDDNDQKSKLLYNELNHNYNRVDALFSIYKVLEFRSLLPIMFNWRVSSDYAHLLLEKIIANNKNGNFLDVGSGISTIIAGYAIEKKGIGKVISLEHDKYYYEQTTELISTHELSKFIDLYYCPLIKYEIDGEEWLWYDIKNVEGLNNINIISVDGPPGITQLMARYPVIPILYDKLERGTIILLDDGLRDEEKQIAKRWVNEFNAEKVFLNTHKGTLLLTV